MTVGSVRAAVVTVGEELLSGATVDANAAWLGRALGALGVPVERSWTVGDRDDAIAESVLAAARVADLVIVTGGLGPTEDDRTRPALARALGAELDEDPALVRHLEGRLRASGRSALSDGLRRLALRPTPGRWLANPAGAAPGLVFEGPREGGWVIALPGVPREMRGLFPAVADFVRETFDGRLTPVLQRTLHTTGLPESELAPRVDAVAAEVGEGVEVAFLPDLTGVDLRLTTRHDGTAAARAAAAERLDRLDHALRPILAGHRFEASSGDLVETVAALLEARGWWLATAESCTGGLVAQRWTARAGSSSTFRGAVVAYHNDVKERLLDVPGAVLEAQGAVSEPVARAMAEGVARRLDAQCGIGITGVAGPGGGSDEKPVGTVWIAATVPSNGAAPCTRAVRFQFGGDRESVRVRAAQAALHLLHGMLEGGPFEPSSPRAGRE